MQEADGADKGADRAPPAPPLPVQEAGGQTSAWNTDVRPPRDGEDADRTGDSQRDERQAVHHQRPRDNVEAPGGEREQFEEDIRGGVEGALYNIHRRDRLPCAEEERQHGGGGEEGGGPAPHPDGRHQEECEPGGAGRDQQGQQSGRRPEEVREVRQGAGDRDPGHLGEAGDPAHPHEEHAAGGGRGPGEGGLGDSRVRGQRCGESVCRGGHAADQGEDASGGPGRGEDRQQGAQQSEDIQAELRVCGQCQRPLQS